MLMLAILMLTPASAQVTAVNAAPHIAAALLAQSDTPRPGTTSAIAISMTPTLRDGKQWHGYWVNGGDAGFGMQIVWDLPPGVSIGPLAYPVPDTLIVGGLMNHVYERPYALIAPLTLAPAIAPGTRLTITGRANWLACTDEVCVPERGTWVMNLIAGDGAVTPGTAAQFANWRAALPPPLGSEARFAVANDTLRIAIPLPATLALSRPHLFVETTRANQPGGAQRFLRQGDTLIVETPAGDDAPTMQSLTALLRIGDARGLTLTARPGAVPVGGDLVALVPAASDGGAQARASGPVSAGFDAALFASALVGAIIGGLILNVMPCVFPILSLKAMALARAGGDERSVRAEGVAYTAGAVLTCLLLGAVLLLLRASGEALGWAFQLQRPESVLLLIILMGAITANLAGLFEFGTLSFGNRISGGSDTKNAFATGALAAFIATPCTGPFLGAALGATLTLPSWAALPIFGGLGLGLAMPFLALALFPALRSRLPRPGPWMVTMRRWLAVPMALTAAALVWLLGRQVGGVGWAVGGAALLATLALGWWAGRQQRTGINASVPIFAMAALIVPVSLLLPSPAHRASDYVADTASGLPGAQPWSAASLAAARARNGSVFVYFTADWCVTCKVNEASSIDRSETARAFAAGNVTTLIADWTNADPAITAELGRHGRNSVPLYLWYKAGDENPEILPQILTPAMLAERAALTPTMPAR